MIDIGIIDQQQKTLEDLLKGDSSYRVPYFQREYSWRSDDWNDFFEDLNRARKNKAGHFFGFMTFRKESNNEISIIEGQQRLTTTTILFGVIRDIFYSVNDNYWQKLEEENIKVKDYLSLNSPAFPKLVLSEFNKNFFSKYIQEVDTPANKIIEFEEERKVNSSNALIFQCYKFFYEEITQQTKKLADPEKKELLIELVKTSLRNFIVISTYVVDNRAAFNIFQTLNDRGLDLAISDLVKMHLLEFAGTSWEDAKSKWDEIREILSTINVNTFLRHYWLSTRGVINEKELLHEIEKITKTRDSVFSFLDNLKEEAEDYEAILNRREDYWENPRIVESLEESHNISVQMPLPFLLAASKLKGEDFLKSIKLCTNLIFTYITIAEKENKLLERTLSDAALEMRREKENSLSGIADKFRKICPDQGTFKNLFSKKEIKSAKVARYILERIEYYLSGEKEKVNKKITLEHILPQNPDREWEQYLSKEGIDKDEYVHRIGNLTLLLGKVNKIAQNQYFVKKRDEIYKKMTDLKINIPLRDIETWSIKDIETRQELFADYALKIWKL